MRKSLHLGNRVEEVPKHSVVGQEPKEPTTKSKITSISSAFLISFNKIIKNRNIRTPHRYSTESSFEKFDYSLRNMQRPLNVNGSLHSHDFSRKDLEFEISPKNKGLSIQLGLGSPLISKRISPKNISLGDKVSETSSPAAYTKYFPSSTRHQPELPKYKDFPLNPNALLSSTRASASTQKKIEFPTYYKKQEIVSLNTYSSSKPSPSSQLSAKSNSSANSINNNNYSSSNTLQNTLYPSQKNFGLNANSVIGTSKFFDIYKSKPEYTSSPLTQGSKQRLDKRLSPQATTKDKHSLVYSSLDQAILQQKFTRPPSSNEETGGTRRLDEFHLSQSHTEKILNFSKKLLMSGNNAEGMSQVNNSKLSTGRDLSKISPSAAADSQRSLISSFTLAQKNETKPETKKYGGVFHQLFQNENPHCRAMDNSASTTDASSLGTSSEFLKQYYNNCKSSKEFEKQIGEKHPRVSPVTKVNNFVNTLAEISTESERGERYSRFLFSENEGGHNSSASQLPNNILSDCNNDNACASQNLQIDMGDQRKKKKRYQISLLSIGSQGEDMDDDEEIDQTARYMSNNGNSGSLVNTEEVRRSCHQEENKLWSTEKEYHYDLSAVLRKTKNVLRGWEMKEQKWIQEKEGYLKKIEELEKIVINYQRVKKKSHES